AWGTDGNGCAWGANNLGQCGTGLGPDPQLTPTQVPRLADIKQVAAADLFSLALTASGTVYEFGENVADPTQPPIRTPQLVAGVSRIVQIAAYGDHALLMDADGTVFRWGDNSSGVLGGTAARYPTPTRFKELPLAATIATGHYHSLATSVNGTTFAWGSNDAGQLGIGSADGFGHPLPVMVAGLPRAPVQ